MGSRWRRAWQWYWMVRLVSNSLGKRLSKAVFTLYLLRVAGSAMGGTAESGQGYMQNMLWACLSV